MKHPLSPKAPVALGTAHQQQLLAGRLCREGLPDHNGKNPGVFSDLVTGREYLAGAGENEWLLGAGD